MRAHACAKQATLAVGVLKSQMMGGARVRVYLTGFWIPWTLKKEKSPVCRLEEWTYNFVNGDHVSEEERRSCVRRGEGAVGRVGERERKFFASS